MVRGGVEQRGGKLDFEGLGALDEIDHGGYGDGLAAEQFGGGLGEFRASADFVVVGLGVFDQGGGGAEFAGEEMGGLGGEAGVGCGQFFDECRTGLCVHVPCRAGGGFAELEAQVTNLGCGVREQAGDLGFEGAGVDDLAERCVGSQGEQVAGDVEGAGLQRALVGLGLHLCGARNATAQGLQNG